MAWSFAIRDDDISYYTQPEELAEVYDGVLGVCPVSLATVPFHLPWKPNVPYSGDWAAPGPGIPLGENPALVTWLRQYLALGQVAIMLHGCEHDIPRKPEFVVGDFTTLKEKVGRGKTYLEKLLETKIRVFVPPQNRMSQAGLDAVVSMGLNICPVQSMRLRRRRRRIYNFLRQRWWVMRYGFRVPGPLFFASHYEIPSYYMGPRTNLDDLRATMRHIAQSGGLFVLALHYWEAKEKLQGRSMHIKEAVHSLIKEAKKLGDCHFTSLNDIG